MQIFAVNKSTIYNKSSEINLRRFILKKKSSYISKIAIFMLMFCFVQKAHGADVISDLRERLKLLGQKQSVISQNIANADTPNYKAKRVVTRSKFKGSKLGGVSLRTTSNMHIGGGRFSNSKYSVKEQRDTYDTALNGNNVVLDEQVSKMAKADLEYQKTVGVMRQMTGLLRSAIGGNR